MTTTADPVAGRVNEDISAIVDAVRAALVVVRNRHRQGVGAGTVLRDDGLVLTSAHVIGKTAPRVVLPDGSELPAEVLALDRERDLAALHLDATGLCPVALGDSKGLQPGELVLALGHPGGVPGVATAGTLLGVGSDWPGLPGDGRDWLVASLRLRPGHSGGPVVDTRGRLVGVNAVMAGPGLGLAVPAHVVAEFLRAELD